MALHDARHRSVSRPADCRGRLIAAELAVGGPCSARQQRQHAEDEQADKPRNEEQATDEHPAESGGAAR